jgi:hypothetical protein
MLENTTTLLLTLISNIGHVADNMGNIYQLNNTGHNNVRVITLDRQDGYYIHPVSYHIESSTHACNFYSESTRGVGYLIGEFQGPVDADFVGDWAAFYECWDVDSEPALPPRRRRRGLQARRLQGVE